MTGEGNGFLFLALGTISDSPVIGVGTVHGEGQNGGTGFLTGGGFKVNDFRLYGSGISAVDLALEFVESIDGHGDLVDGVSIQIAEHRNLVLDRSGDGVAVGIGADDGEQFNEMRLIKSSGFNAKIFAPASWSSCLSL